MKHNIREKLTPIEKHARWAIWLIVISLFIWPIRCSNDDPPQGDTVEYGEDLTPLLIQAEDLGWSSGYYDIDKEFDLPIFGDIPPQQVWNVIISPVPATGGGKHPVSHNDMRSGGQTIAVFENEETAKQEFEAFVHRVRQFDAAGGWIEFNDFFDYRIKNWFAHCHHFSTNQPGFARLEECDALMQSGPYLVFVSMTIDESLTTKQHWIVMFEVVEKRLAEHVLGEP